MGALLVLNRILNRAVPLHKRAVQAANLVLEWGLGGRLRLVHVVEFPKCGGSWIRDMVRTYRGTDLFLDDRLVRKNDVILTHHLFSRRFRRSIVVVRDPRDVYVSFYYFQTSFQNRNSDSPLFRHYSHDPNRPVDEDFGEYLRAKLLYPSHPWFSYSRFLESWHGRRESCVVHYEDCLKAPANELSRIVEFLNEPLDPERIAETVAKTSFEAVTREKYGESRKPGEADQTKFHRKGIVGDWKSHFNREACRLLEKAEGPALRRLGYESDTSWVDRQPIRPS